MTAPTTLLDQLREQEHRLVFDGFDESTAWTVGSTLRATALGLELPVAISVRRNGQRLFHTALPGASADNDAWLERKCAVVDRFGHSSLLIGEQYRAGGTSFEAGSRLDPDRFAAHGGAFPVLVRGTGCVGTIAVSGLPQRADHDLVVRVLADHLGVDLT